MAHEFTHIATPEENAFIESYNSNIKIELINRHWLESLYHARMKIMKYYGINNYKRKQKSIKRINPFHL
ncbi:MAG: transposase [Bacteroidales bacterium]|nr:transposase [Bacteroidales bacterium]